MEYHRMFVSIRFFALQFCFIHARIELLQEGIEIGVLLAYQWSTSCTQAEHIRALSCRIGLCENLLQPLKHAGNFAFGKFRGEQGELITAIAAYHCMPWNRLLQEAGNAHQSFITLGMAEGIIYVFKAVDVQHEGPLGVDAFLFGECKVSHLLKVPAIEQPCQVITIDLVCLYVEKENQKRDGKADPQYLQPVEHDLQYPCNENREWEDKQRTVYFSFQLLMIEYKVDGSKHQVQVIADDGQKEVWSPAVLRELVDHEQPSSVDAYHRSHGDKEDGSNKQQQKPSFRTLADDMLYIEKIEYAYRWIERIEYRRDHRHKGSQRGCRSGDAKNINAELTCQ